MDWMSVSVGAIIGAISTLFVYEYQRWRNRKTEIRDRESKVKDMLRSNLNKVILGWENFKKTEEMHVDPGLTNFLYQLDSISHALRDITSASDKLISKDLLVKTTDISGKLTKLSHKQFYINGGHSWKQFIDFGDEVIKECRALTQKF